MIRIIFSTHLFIVQHLKTILDPKDTLSKMSVPFLVCLLLLSPFFPTVSLSVSPVSFLLVLLTLSSFFYIHFLFISTGLTFQMHYYLSKCALNSEVYSSPFPYGPLFLFLSPNLFSPLGDVPNESSSVWYKGRNTAISFFISFDSVVLFSYPCVSNHLRNCCSCYPMTLFFCFPHQPLKKWLIHHFKYPLMHCPQEAAILVNSGTKNTTIHGPDTTHSQACL